MLNENKKKQDSEDDGGAMDIQQQARDSRGHNILTPVIRNRQRSNLTCPLAI